MERACLACGASLDGTRQKKYCANNGKCKMRYHRGARSGATDRVQARESGLGAVAAATLLKLQESGRLHTPLGQAALALAHRLDMSHMDTGAGVASLAKQLEATLSAATADVEVADDPIDELKAARERKRNAASG